MCTEVQTECKQSANNGKGTYGQTELGIINTTIEYFSVFV